MFWGHEDVYAKRGKNGGYFPQCNNRWDNRLCPKQRGEKIFCDDCENTKWTRLDAKKIISHLLGYGRMQQTYYRIQDFGVKFSKIFFRVLDKNTCSNYN